MSAPAGDPAAANVHATAIVVGRAGLLVTGASGSGKSTLALGLVLAARAAGLHSALVADDRTLLRRAHHRLVASAPATIAGLVEIHHLGPVAMTHEDRALIDLELFLDAADAAPRLQEAGTGMLAGVALPRLILPSRSARAGMLAAAGWLAGRGLVSRSFAG